MHVAVLHVHIIMLSYFFQCDMYVYTCTCTIDAWAFKGTAMGYIFHVPL